MLRNPRKFGGVARIGAVAAAVALALGDRLVRHRFGGGQEARHPGLGARASSFRSSST